MGISNHTRGFPCVGTITQALTSMSEDMDE